MIPAAFDYRRAASVEQAIELLDDEDAKLLAGGHSGGLAALLGPRALYAMLLAVAIGAVIALALRGADVAIALAARRRATPRPTTLISRPRPRAADVVRRRPIALELAGRGPPHASG